MGHKPGTWHNMSDEEFNEKARKILEDARLGQSSEDGELKPLDEDYMCERLRSPPKDPYIDAVPTSDDTLVKVYQLFQERFGIPNRVFYPSCDIDATPARGFPNSRVVFLDINEKAIAVLNRSGIEALVGDARKHIPEVKYDLVILLNPGIKSSAVTSTLRRGGYIIANEWHGNTSQLLSSPIRYAFEGTVHHGRNPMELLSVPESKKLLERTDPFFNLYSIFRKRF